MRKVIAGLLAALVMSGGAASAQTSESDLKSLMTYYEARGWEGVGRINIGFGGMCTGAMISASQVLTAAHCLYDKRTGQRVDASKMQFLAGWRQGRATAQRRIKRAIAHPEYVFKTERGEIQVENDVALLELDSPIVLYNITPFKVAPRPRKGTRVGVVSYAHDRPDTPSIQEVCHVLARQRGSLVLSCDVDFGSSGAPVFVEVDGHPRIASVVSAKALVHGRKVALGTSLEGQLVDLQRLMSSTAGNDAKRESVVQPSTLPQVRQLNGGSAGGAAKFVKP